MSKQIEISSKGTGATTKVRNADGAPIDGISEIRIDIKAGGLATAYLTIPNVRVFVTADEATGAPPPPPDTGGIQQSGAFLPAWLRRLFG